MTTIIEEKIQRDREKIQGDSPSKGPKGLSPVLTIIDQRVKIFLESWALRAGELDEKASCAVCGRDLVDGKFAMIDGTLMCLDCKEGRGRNDIVQE